ncbi:unnamed protein product, partial [Mesorhabditis spiculigera]
MASMAIIPVKLGQRVQIDIAGAKSFKRSYATGVEETFKICADEKDLSPKCTHWSDKNGKVLTETSRIRGFKNGTLVLEKIVLEDLANYWSPEKQNIETKHSDGSVSSVLGPLGERVQIHIEGANSFKRTFQTGVEEFFKICDDENDSSPKCTHWSDKDGKVLTDTTPVRGFKNGTLLIEKVDLRDLTEYMSPEQQFIETNKHADGSVSGVLGPVYTVFLPRTLRNGDVQLFKVCDDEKDRSPKCTRWTDSKGKVLSNTSPIHAFKNGTLVIEKVTKEDLASYTSPELDAAALKKGPAGVAVSGPQLSLVE